MYVHINIYIYVHINGPNLHPRIGKSHRKDAFLLALLADILHRVSLGGRADHVTAEGQRFAGHRAQVHFQRNAPGREIWGWIWGYKILCLGL